MTTNEIKESPPLLSDFIHECFIDASGWNQARQKYEEIDEEWIPDLRDIDLRGVRVRTLDTDDVGLNLSHVVLEGADLSYSSLYRADLTCAHMRGATLTRVDMRNTILDEANLTNAKASSVHMKGADLRGAMLKGADLTDADMTDADVDQTPAEWATVTGLETIKGLPHGLRADAFATAMMSVIGEFMKPQSGRQSTIDRMIRDMKDRAAALYFEVKDLEPDQQRERIDDLRAYAMFDEDIAFLLAELEGLAAAYQQPADDNHPDTANHE